MFIDPVALVQAGAAALVAAMSTQMWGGLSQRVARLMSRGRPDDEATVQERLDEARTAIDQARSEAEVHDAEAGLRSLLRARLRDDPDLASQFDALVAEVREQLGDQPGITVIRQDGRATHGGTVIQGGRDAYGGQPRQ